MIKNNKQRVAQGEWDEVFHIPSRASLARFNRQADRYLAKRGVKPTKWRDNSFVFGKNAPE